MTGPLITEQEQPAASRLPLPILAAALVALAALCLVRHVWVLPGLFGLALVLPYLVSARIATAPARGLLRLLLFSLALLAAFQPHALAQDELVNVRWSNLFGYLCAAEIVVQAWSRRPHTLLLFLLPCGVLLAAGNTYDSPWIQRIAPLFILCLTPGFRWYRPRPAVRPQRAVLLTGVLLLATLGLGFAVNIAVLRYQVALNAWGAQVMPVASRGNLGISLAPVLGRRSGPQGSSERVLRLDGSRSIYYLRGMAFDTYHQGHWTPTLLERSIQIIPRHTPKFGFGSVQLHIAKLAPLNDLLFTPLATGDISTGSAINWSPDYGGPLLGSASKVMSYGILLTTPGLPSIWPAPTPDRRAQMLEVPAEIDPGIIQLARQIGGNASSPQMKVQKVVQYLLTNYHYSASIDPGSGDPVSNFLLMRKSADCEYFASAATILLRCLGVPTRYVVGYYAHEFDLGSSMVVRQRDAHAWVEAWVDGDGWKTIEATPAGGRPDARRDTLPSRRQYLKAWLQDTRQAINSRLRHLRPWLLAIIPAGLLLYLLLLGWRLLRQRRRRRDMAFHALPADRRLASAAMRFAAWLARAGAPCPPGIPWQEHLARLEADLPAEARAFVQAYNGARFGPAQRDDDLMALSTLLAKLENTPLSRPQ